VGTIIGVVDRARLIDGRTISPGDVILGLPSTGLHTNGYSLARNVLDDLDWQSPSPSLDGRTIAEILLEPHRSYLDDIEKLWQRDVDVRGLAHITGGGLVDNPPRVFPDGLGARLRRGSWFEPPIFQLIQQQGHISDAEMFHVFNMGLGMLLILSPEEAGKAQQILPGAALVGEIVPGIGGVLIE